MLSKKKVKKLRKFTTCKGVLEGMGFRKIGNMWVRDNSEMPDESMEMICDFVDLVSEARNETPYDILCSIMWGKDSEVIKRASLNEMISYMFR